MPSILVAVGLMCDGLGPKRMLSSFVLGFLGFLEVFWAR